MRFILRWQMLFWASSLLLMVSTPSAVAQVDTDGDGLLDVLDVEEFDPNASGTLRLIGLGIQDLDGANLLTNLQELFLDINRIRSIESGDFDGLANLQDLTLNNNRIASIENGVFEGMASLQGLALHNNRIAAIENGAFDGRRGHRLNSPSWLWSPTSSRSRREGTIMSSISPIRWPGKSSRAR